MELERLVTHKRTSYGGDSLAIMCSKHSHSHTHTHTDVSNETQRGQRNICISKSLSLLLGNEALAPHKWYTFLC